VARRFFAWQERDGLSHADAWTVASACLRDRAAGFGADPARITLLPNGISAAPVSAPPSKREAKSDTILLYTRFAGVRAADVAAIWAHVREMRPSARLRIIGRGVAGEEAMLSDLPGVEIAGWLPAEVLPEEFARAAAAMIPWADAPTNRARHSAKVLELMAAGLPLVATAVGELPNTLGRCGVIVPPADAGAFAAALAALLDDPDRREELGRAAEVRVAAHFTWERLAGVALEVYKLALSRRESL
jgi:glycosyltransferase involved in cell wall biosynthesis